MEEPPLVLGKSSRKPHGSQASVGSQGSHVPPQSRGGGSSGRRSRVPRVLPACGGCSQERRRPRVVCSQKPPTGGNSTGLSHVVLVGGVPRKELREVTLLGASTIPVSGCAAPTRRVRRPRKRVRSRSGRQSPVGGPLSQRPEHPETDPGQAISDLRVLPELSERQTAGDIVHADLYMASCVTLSRGL